MGFEDDCNTGLVLGLSLNSSLQTNHISKTKPRLMKMEPATPTTSLTSLEPSLTLGLSRDSNQGITTPTKINVQRAPKAAAAAGSTAAPATENSPRQASSPHSVVSSFSNSLNPKRERDVVSEEVEVEKGSSRASDEDDEHSNSTRKKLRLTKEQSALLEESFKQHSTLNPKQKQALARQLNLRPRQVEVWFQNRRARTKLKQTEVDCEFLKKCCETLTDENRRLHKELQELKALKLGHPFYMHMPAATLTMCPSCERIGGGIADNPTKSPFSMAPKPHFFNPFTNPSAAC